MRFSKELRRLLIGGLLVLTAASLTACGASKEDPWSYDASFSQDILISSDPGETLFTGDEWTGKTFARDAQGSFVSMSDIVRINTLDYHTVGTVVYDSVEKALEGSISYDRSGSKYYKLLTDSEASSPCL